jgi:hypothetical protein
MWRRWEFILDYEDEEGENPAQVSEPQDDR